MGLRSRRQARREAKTAADPAADSHATTSYDDGTSKSDSELFGANAQQVALEQSRLALEQQREQVNQNKLENKLRNRVALCVLIGTAVQIAVADIAFGLYAYTLHWRLPVAAISAWLGSLVVEVIGIAIIVVRFLFPDRTRKQ